MKLLMLLIFVLLFKPACFQPIRECCKLLRSEKETVATSSSIKFLWKIKFIETWNATKPYSFRVQLFDQDGYNLRENVLSIKENYYVADHLQPNKKYCLQIRMVFEDGKQQEMPLEICGETDPDLPMSPENVAVVSAANGEIQVSMIIAPTTATIQILVECSIDEKNGKNFNFSLENSRVCKSPFSCFVLKDEIFEDEDCTLQARVYDPSFQSPSYLSGPVKIAPKRLDPRPVNDSHTTTTPQSTAVITTPVGDNFGCNQIKDFMSKPFAELIAKIEETAENATTLIEEMAKNSASIMEESAKYFKLWAIVALSIIAVIIFFVIIIWILKKHGYINLPQRDQSQGVDQWPIL